MRQYRKLTTATIGLAVVFAAACSPDNSKNVKPAKTGNSTAADKLQIQKGEQLYQQYCASCHPDGGNVSDPKKNLRKSNLQSKRLNKPEAIVTVMRKPGSRMISFDVSTISDEDARAIALYVLETF